MRKRISIVGPLSRWRTGYDERYRMLRNIRRKLFSKTTNEEMVDKKDLVYHFTLRGEK
jgi:hypothetical protein